MRPPPSRSGLTSRLTRTGAPVVTSADLSCATVHDGWRSLSSAIAPATCGDAMLVPLNTAYEPPGTDDATPSPGAVTSGLNVSVYGAGPIEEKSVGVSSSGLSWPPVEAAT